MFKHLFSFIVTLFFMCLCALAFTQEDKLLISGQFSSYAVDHLGTIYTIENQTRLVKHSQKKNLPSYEYSQKRNGKISAIDVSNPMKVLVAYNDLSTIVVLDNTLKENQSIYLPDLDLYPLNIAFAQNDDLSIWVFDDNNIELIRINSRGQKVTSTTAFIQELGFVPQIENIQANANYTVLFDTKQGFIVCDQFGNYLKNLPVKNIKHWQLVGEAILYQKENQWYRYGLNYFDKSVIKSLDKQQKNPLQTSRGFYFMNSKGVYFQTNDITE